VSDARFVGKGDSLGKFIEECGEALAAAGKWVRFGPDSYNPLPGASKETNRQWLRREVEDLEEAIFLLKKRMGWELPTMSATPKEGSK